MIEKALSILQCVVVGRRRRRSINAGTKEWNPLHFTSIQFNSMTLSDDDDDAPREKGAKKNPRKKKKKKK
jgi:hypothetical protein